MRGICRLSPGVPAGSGARPGPRRRGQGASSARPRISVTPPAGVTTGVNEIVLVVALAWLRVRQLDPDAWGIAAACASPPAARAIAVSVGAPGIHSAGWADLARLFRPGAYSRSGTGQFPVRWAYHQAQAPIYPHFSHTYTSKKQLHGGYGLCRGFW
jgi:hypothetical protein